MTSRDTFLGLTKIDWLVAAGTGFASLAVFQSATFRSFTRLGWPTDVAFALGAFSVPLVWVWFRGHPKAFPTAWTASLLLFACSALFGDRWLLLPTVAPWVGASLLLAAVLVREGAVPPIAPASRSPDAGRARTPQ